MDKNNNLQKSPLRNSYHIPANPKPQDPVYKARPISALLSLKILNNDLPNEKTVIKDTMRDLSLEQIERQKTRFHKNFLLPEIEAKNQSFIQYVDDIMNMFDTVNNDKNEEFLPFYTINAQKHEIVKKFICLNRETKTFPKRNVSLQRERGLGDIDSGNKSRDEKLKMTKNFKIFKGKRQEKEKTRNNEKLAPGNLDIIDLLLQKENAMDRNNFNRIFALTEKDGLRSFPKQNFKNEETNKTLKTLDLNNNEAIFLPKSLRPAKINYFENHLMQLKSRTTPNLSRGIEQAPAIILPKKEPKSLAVSKLKQNMNKNFNFSKQRNPIPGGVNANAAQEEPPKKHKTLNLKNLHIPQISAQNHSEMKQSSRRTENLQGWNDESSHVINEEISFGEG